MPTDKKRIQAYVSLTTYQMIQGQAESEGISVSEAAARILNTYLGDPSTASVSQVDMSQYITRQEFEARISGLLTEIGAMEGRYQGFHGTMQSIWMEAMDAAANGKSIAPSKGELKRLKSLKG